MTREIRRSAFGIIPRSVGAMALALVLAIAAIPAAIAQEATPPVTNVEGGTPAAIDPDTTAIAIVSPDEDGVEQQIGTASFEEEEGQVTIRVEVATLEPGDHGIHIHEIGICDPDADPQYSTAGGHFNPTGESHGPGPQAEEDVESHAGDLGNITIDEDGTGILEVTTDRISLQTDAENTLADEDGSALVIHEDPDDLETDPSGNSGNRIACGVIFAGLDATPVVMGN